MGVDIGKYFTSDNLTTMGAIASAILLFLQNRLLSRQTKIIEDQWKKEQPRSSISFRFNDRFWHHHNEKPIELEIENRGNTRLRIDRAELIVKKTDEIIRTLNFADRTIKPGEVITSTFIPKSLPRIAPLLLRVYFFSSNDNFRYQNTVDFDEDFHAL